METSQINLSELEPIKIQPDSPIKQTFGIFGNPKTGKSSLCARFPNALILNTEREESYSNVGVSCYSITIKSWKDFMNMAHHINNQEHKFEIVVIDTINSLFRMCVDSVCRSMGWSDISSPQFGAGYTLVRETFKKRIFPLLRNSKIGITFVAHAKIRDFGADTNKLSFDFEDKELPGWIRGECSSLIYSDGENFMYRATDKIDCGTRWQVEKNEVKINHDDWNLTYKNFINNFIQKGAE